MKSNPRKKTEGIVQHTKIHLKDLRVKLSENDSGIEHQGSTTLTKNLTATFAFTTKWYAYHLSRKNEKEGPR